MAIAFTTPKSALEALRQGSFGDVYAEESEPDSISFSFKNITFFSD